MTLGSKINKKCLELLVEVAAAALNRADLLMRAGRYDPTSADWTVAANRTPAHHPHRDHVPRSRTRRAQPARRLATGRPQLASGWDGITPGIDSIYPLHAAEDAAHRAAAPDLNGKVVITVADVRDST